MCALLAETEDAAERLHWLTVAAEAGYVPAMYQLGLAAPDPRQRARWLDAAARRGCEAAAAELADTW